jgi:RNA polymerase sigma-70 factor (ECF subfamily)
MHGGERIGSEPVSRLSVDVWERATPDERVQIEGTWLRLIVGRDERDSRWAFEQFYRAYVNPVLAIARARLGGSDAEDVVQAVFLDIWRLRARLPLATLLRKYVYGALQHRLASAYRSNGRRARVSDPARHNEATGGGEWTAGPPDALERAEGEQAWLDALDALPARTRLIVLLSYGHGFSRPEIAALVGVSLETVRDALADARPVLRHLLRPEATPVTGLPPA